MGSLHFIGGEKGGVGKSFTARLLSQYMVDSHRPFVGFDTDASHSTFSRFYEQFTAPINVEDFESFDQIVEFADENPTGNIIVDLAAQTSAKLRKWADDCELFDLMDDLDFKIYYWHVMDDSADSVFLLNKLLKEFNHPNVELVVVENLGRGAGFKNFEATELYRHVQTKGIKVLTLARLHESLTQKIDFNNYSFWAAANSRQVMKITEMQRVRTWLKHAYLQIDRVMKPDTDDNAEQVLSETVV